MNKKNFFDIQSKNWDKFIDKNTLEKISKNIIPKFKVRNSDKVIDIGSGTGILIPFLLEMIDKKGKIYALDYSKKMLDIAKKKFGRKCEYVCCDAHSMKFKDEYFDVAICFNVFPHFDDKEKVLKEIFRILKKNGRFYIAHSDSLKKIHSIHKNAHKVIMNDKMLTNKEIKYICKKIGFSNIKILNKKNYYFFSAIKK